jgi:hypothetical protein
MFIAIVWVALAFACGWLAAKRGRSGVGWCVAALLASPFIAGMLVLLLPVQASVEMRRQQKRCKQCDPRGRRSAGECTQCLASVPFNL